MTKLRLLYNFYIKQNERFQMENKNELEKKREFDSLLEELKEDSSSGESRDELLQKLLALVDSAEKAESLVAACKAEEIAWVRQDLNQAW